MDAGLRTPLLDFFRRGDVARDVRMQAAQGAIAPRPLEQLAILMLLASDPDTEIRQTAEATLAALPPEAVAGVIARADVPTELREYFVGRGIRPAATPAPDDPLDAVGDLDETGLGFGSGGEEAGGRQPTFTERLGTMTVPEKIKCAIKGTREMRAVLIRDPNRIVASAVLSCPKVNDAEIETFAKMGNVSEDILRTIGMTRAWTKNYNVTLALVKNAKTPVALSLSLLQRLIERDLKMLSTDRNVPEPLRVAARKKFVSTQK